MVFPQVVVNQDKEAIMSKEVYYPAETLISAVAGQVVVARVGLTALGRRWQGWWIMPCLHLPSWGHGAVDQVSRGRRQPLTTPMPGRQVVQILEAEGQPDSVEA